MNGTTTFDYGKAMQDADQIIAIANKVEALFREAETEANKTVNAEGVWKSTNDSSTQEAMNLFKSYKSNFEGFLSKIKQKAEEIKKAGATYSSVGTTASQNVDTAFKINAK